MLTRKSWLILLMALSLGLLTACAGAQPEPAPEPTEAPAAEPTEKPAEPTEAPAAEPTEAPAAEAEPEEAGSPFAGETIEIIIPYGEGGGSDTWTRALAPFLQKYLGDDVVVQPINMPGASGVQGANEFGVVRDHDGLSLLVSSGSNVLPYLLGEEAVKYDFADFSGVMGSPVGGVVYTSPDTGITDVAGLCAGGAELIYGGLSPTGLDLVPLLAFELMGVDFIPILGYDGRGAARVAFEQGETNLDYQTSPAFLKNVQPLVDEGSAVPLFAFGILDSNGDIVRDPVFSDLPSFAEAYEECHGSAPSGTEYDAFKAAFAAGFAAQKNLWVHGDAPQERIDALTAAAEQVLADAEFAEVAGNLIGDYEFYAGADNVATAFGAASQLSQESFDWLLTFLSGVYDVALTAESATEVEEAPAAAEVDPAAFAGETIEIIIPYGEGGGSDTWTRALAPFLQKYLGDDVVVQPINMPGASGVQGANEFGVVREHDGLSLLVSSGSNVLPYLLGEEAVKYDFAEFSGVMGSPVGGVVYTSPDTGITDVAGLCAGGAELIYGGLSPTGLDLVPLLAFELMGLDFIPILGYDGRGAARVAFEQGETNLDYQTSPAFLKNVQPLVDEGLAVPLFAFGILDANGDVVRDPVFSDLPSFAEAYEECTGAAPSGTEYEAFKASLAAGFAAQKNLWVHGDAPQERIDALTAAAQLTLADAEFAEVAGNLIGDYEFYAGADNVNAAFGAASQLSQESFDWLVGWLADKYEVSLSADSATAVEQAPAAEVDPAAFAGETIEIIIPYGEGGGSDTWTRALAPFLQKYLGDDVVVQPINMPGASGVQGANEFGVVREHDGLSLLVSSGSNVLPYLLGEEAVKYDFAEFSGVMGSPVGGVVYTSPDTGITDVAGLCAGGAELIYGGLSPTGLDLVPLLAFELMGLDFIPILGYDGRGAARVAFEQGETNLDYQTSPAFLKNVQPLVDEGLAVPLFAFGILDANGDVVRDPVFSDLPSFAEAYEECTGAAPSGTEYEAFKASLAAGFAAQKNLWVHGDAPQERIDALTAAAQLVLADAEFAEVAGNLIGDYKFYAGADNVNAAFGAASQLSQESFDWLVGWLAEKYEVSLSADAATAVEQAPAAEVDPAAFAGETIEIIIPYGEGGGSDTWTRALAPFLQKYLGDDVVVQPINMPGASGVQGANEFGVVRDHDGLSLLVSSGSNVLPYLLGEEAVKYDFAEFSGVMGSPVGGVVYVSPDTGITDVAGLCAGGVELVYGGLSPTGLDLVPLLGFELMGLDFIPILGYDGRGAARVAFEQGETNLDYQTSPAFLKNVQPLVDEGSAIPLFAFGILDANGDVVRDPVFSDLPSFAEAYEECTGAAPSGTEYEAFKASLAAGFAAQKNLWVHGDAPQERIDALTAAAQMVLADAEFAEVAGNLIGDYKFYAGADDVNAAFGAASALSPESFDWLVNFLAEKYEVNLQ